MHSFLLLRVNCTDLEGVNNGRPLSKAKARQVGTELAPLGPPETLAQPNDGGLDRVPGRQVIHKGLCCCKPALKLCITP